MEIIQLEDMVDFLSEVFSFPCSFEEETIKTLFMYYMASELAILPDPSVYPTLN